MKRNKRTIRRLKYYNLIFSSVSGIALITALILLFSYAASAAGMSDGIISVLGSLTICSGGYFSGFLYGKQKRHKGIKNGVICGIIIYAVIFSAGIIYLKGIPPFRLTRFLIMLCIAGAAGGVTGVNSKIKRPPL